MFVSVASTAVTEAPILARDSERSPPPQPTSIKRNPASGSGSEGSNLKCSQRDLRMKEQRTGFMECNIEKGPSGRHHSAAMAANFAVSLASILPPVLEVSGAAVKHRAVAHSWPCGRSSMSGVRDRGPGGQLPEGGRSASVAAALSC
mmetsp:Transcript_5559/g.15514  ORF Transcript_5559/g.15514 Transcript_5559/m.15514 type:complete len:147 (+) Transcript_5559:1025-1465(+)